MTASLARSLIAGVAAMCVSVCTLGGSSSSNETRRGKLSDAMEKASEKTTGNRTVPTEPAIPVPPAGDETMSTSPDSSRSPVSEAHEPAAPEPSEKKPPRNWLGLRLGGGTLKARDFDAIGEFGILVGSYFSDRVYGEISGYFSSSSLKTSSSLNNSIQDDVIIVGIGMEGKYFLTPSHTFLGPYVLMGLNLSHMSWDYQNPITAHKYDNYGNVVGTERITSDALSGLDMFIGVGFHLFQFSGVHIGAEVTPGLILWNNTTSEGFDNDVFRTFYYLKLRAHMNIGL